MVGYAKIIAIALLVTVCAAAGYAAVSAYNGAIERAKELEGENKTLTSSLNEQIADNARMAERQKATDKLLAERQVQRQAAADLERRIGNAVQQVVANSKEDRDWWNARAPDGVRLAGAGASGDLKDGRGAPAAKPAAGKPGP